MLLVVGRLLAEFLHTGLVGTSDGFELLQGIVHDGTDAGMTVSVFLAAEGDDCELAHGLLTDGAGGLWHPSIEEIMNGLLLDLELSNGPKDCWLRAVDFMLGGLLDLEGGHA